MRSDVSVSTTSTRSKSGLGRCSQSDVSNRHLFLPLDGVLDDVDPRKVCSDAAWNV